MVRVTLPEIFQPVCDTRLEISARTKLYSFTQAPSIKTTVAKILTTPIHLNSLYAIALIAIVFLKGFVPEGELKCKPG